MKYHEKYLYAIFREGQDQISQRLGLRFRKGVGASCTKLAPRISRGTWDPIRCIPISVQIHTTIIEA